MLGDINIARQVLMGFAGPRVGDNWKVQRQTALNFFLSTVS
jgi:acetyl-CoA carboxylase beta subunit